MNLLAIAAALLLSVLSFCLGYWATQGVLVLWTELRRGR